MVCSWSSLRHGVFFVVSALKLFSILLLSLGACSPRRFVSEQKSIPVQTLAAFDVPLPIGARGVVVRQGEQGGVICEFTLARPLSEMYQFYSKSLDSEGWIKQAQTKTENETIVLVVRPSRCLIVHMAHRGERECQCTVTVLCVSSRHVDGNASPSSVF